MALRRRESHISAQHAIAAPRSMASMAKVSQALEAFAAVREEERSKARGQEAAAATVPVPTGVDGAAAGAAAAAGDPLGAVARPLAEINGVKSFAGAFTALRQALKEYGPDSQGSRTDESRGTTLFLSFRQPDPHRLI